LKSICLAMVRKNDLSKDTTVLIPGIDLDDLDKVMQTIGQYLNP